MWTTAAPRADSGIGGIPAPPRPPQMGCGRLPVLHRPCGETGNRFGRKNSRFFLPLAFWVRKFAPPTYGGDSKVEQKSRNRTIERVFHIWPRLSTVFRGLSTVFGAWRKFRRICTCLDNPPQVAGDFWEDMRFHRWVCQYNDWEWTFLLHHPARGLFHDIYNHLFVPEPCGMDRLFCGEKEKPPFIHPGDCPGSSWSNSASPRRHAERISGWLGSESARQWWRN